MAGATQGVPSLCDTRVLVLSALPLSGAVGLYEADDWWGRQCFRGEDAPLQLDPKTRERISPQEDLTHLHMENLPPWADGAGRQRH